MSTSNEIRDFERKLEIAIKSAFETVIREDNKFDISADFETHTRINDAVENLHLEVYGMSVTPSEFTITFEFCGSFLDIKAKAKPKHCAIRLENDGNYYLTLKEDDLKKSWYLAITGINDSFKSLNEDEILDCLNKFDKNLLLRILSN